MTADRKEDRKYVWYVCGKCKHENFRLKTEEEDDCSECGAIHEAPDGEIGAYVTNGDMEDWTSGIASAPDSWTLSGAGASVARESTIIKAGTYSAKLTRSAADCYLYQSVHATLGINYWRGKTLKVGVWVYATVADRARLLVDDGVDTTDSDYHSGGSGWEYLSVVHTVDSSATELTLQLQINDGDTSAYFDQVCQSGAKVGGAETSIRQWQHGTREASDVPDEIKLDLANPNG